MYEYASAACRNKIRIVGDIAYVQLTQAREAVIDADDITLIGAYRWWAWVRGNHAYAYGCGKHGENGNKLKKMKMHSLILNTPDGMECDHIDGDGLNNRRSNLRLASTSENQCNRPAPMNNTSGYKGVSWHRIKRRWISHIQKSGRLIHLGYFDDPKQAHEAYVAASIELHGEFRR